VKKLVWFSALVGLMALTIVGCGGSGTKSGPQSIFDNRDDAVYSPNGNVPFGSRAYSPDGLRYAQEVAPQYQGNIGVFSRSNNTLFIQFKVLPPNITNALKGIAWSPDSQYLAIMYHGTEPVSKPGIYLYSAIDGQEIRFIGSADGPRGPFHYMVFNRKGDLILLSYDGKLVEISYPSGL
jgi:hypothetical protein